MGTCQISYVVPVHDKCDCCVAARLHLLTLHSLQRQLALAAGGDGTLRMLDVLRSDPLLLLEPSAGGLLAAAWSPSRPLVFAAASGVCHTGGQL